MSPTGRFQSPSQPHTAPRRRPMWSRLARATAAAMLAIMPTLLPLTSVPTASASWPVASPPLLAPVAQGDPCPEPNDTFQSACYLGPNSDAQGFISSGNDVDAYRIEVLDFNTDVHVEMPSMPAAYALYLANWNGDEIATSKPNGSGGAVIDATVDIPGAYYIFVHSAIRRLQRQPAVSAVPRAGVSWAPRSRTSCSPVSSARAPSRQRLATPSLRPTPSPVGATSSP